jgi:hypothetical protein
MATPRLSRALPIFGALATFGCYSGGDAGRTPSLEQIYFPVGIALSAPVATASGDGGTTASASRWMYVANSDFDLQFNAGSLQVYDLDVLRAVAPRYCNADADCDASRPRCDVVASDSNPQPSHWCVASVEAPMPCPTGEQAPADALLYPGLCNPIATTFVGDGGPLLAESVQIGAFVTDITYSRNPSNDGARLFLPVRGDATLHWIDARDRAAPGQTLLDCGQTAAHPACDANHRRGENPAVVDANGNAIVMPPEPFGVAVDASGEAIVIAHQASGEVSLFVNDWDHGAAGGPTLVSLLGGLSSGAMQLAAVPTPALAALTPAEAAMGCATRPRRPMPYQPGFLLTFRTINQVELLSFFDACAANPDSNANGGQLPLQPFLEQTAVSTITANSAGFDSRGIAIDDEARRACEAACGAGAAQSECLLRCASVPLDVYVGNRAPPSLLVGHTTSDLPAPAATTTPVVGVPNADVPLFVDSVPLTAGVSRVVIGKVLNRDGQPETRVFVVCFDSREIFVYDPARRRLETTIHTGRGPQSFVVDTASPAGAASASLPKDPAVDHAFGYVGHFTDSYVGVVDLDQRHTETYGQMILTVGKPVAPRASK